MASGAVLDKKGNSVALAQNKARIANKVEDSGRIKKKRYEGDNKRTVRLKVRSRAVKELKRTGDKGR